MADKKALSDHRRVELEFFDRMCQKHNWKFDRQPLHSPEFQHGVSFLSMMSNFAKVDEEQFQDGKCDLLFRAYQQANHTASFDDRSVAVLRELRESLGIA